MEIEFPVKDVMTLLDNDVKEFIEVVMAMANTSDENYISTELLNKSTNTKKDLAESLDSVTTALMYCRDYLKQALAKTNEMKDDQISYQKRIIELQKEVIDLKSEQIKSVQATVKDTVQDTVKTEFKSYSEAVMKSSSNSVKSITPEQIKKAVKSAVNEDDRSRNVMFFGIQEEKGEDLEKTVLSVCEQLSEKPLFTECSRVGYEKQGTVRPIKVGMGSTETVQRLLSKAKELRETENFKNVFLSHDRTTEERIVRKKLVDELKQMRQNCPEQQHFIRSNKICSRDK